jgi:hypothetical protein
VWLNPTGLAGFFGMTPYAVHQALMGGRVRGQVRRHFAERSPLASVRDFQRELGFRSDGRKRTPAATTPPGSESPSLCFDRHEEHTDESTR